MEGIKKEKKEGQLIKMEEKKVIEAKGKEVKEEVLMLMVSVGGVNGG